MASAALRIAPPALPPVAGADPRPATWRLAQAFAEILSGARRAAQVSELTTPEVLRWLVRNAGQLRAGPGVVRLRPIVDSVHSSEPRPEVVEACAVVNLGARSRAIAFRLELTDGRWRCTAVRVG